MFANPDQEWVPPNRYKGRAARWRRLSANALLRMEAWMEGLPEAWAVELNEEGDLVSKPCDPNAVYETFDCIQNGNAHTLRVPHDMSGHLGGSHDLREAHASGTPVNPHLR